MNEALKTKLRKLADRYEVASFCDEDPSQFLRWYSPEEGRGSVADVEAASFIAAMLAFGNRKQFIPKIRSVLETADRSGGVAAWLKAGTFCDDFPHGAEKFYRFYSYDDMQVFFGELGEILKKAGSLGAFFESKYKEGEVSPRSYRESVKKRAATAGRFRINHQNAQRQAMPDAPFVLHEIISTSFPKSAIVPKGRTSANKRIHMFLRWMVRRGSPVDLGLWTWADPANLLIPLDTHVMQEAVKLGLIPQTSAASRKTAECLTTALSEVFPGDPCRGDFALFGLGVDVI